MVGTICLLGRSIYRFLRIPAFQTLSDNAGGELGKRRIDATYGAEHLTIDGSRTV